MLTYEVCQKRSRTGVAKTFQIQATHFPSKNQNAPSQPCLLFLYALLERFLQDPQQCHRHSHFDVVCILKHLDDPLELGERITGGLQGQKEETVRCSGYCEQPCGQTEAAISWLALKKTQQDLFVDMLLIVLKEKTCTLGLEMSSFFFTPILALF